MLEEIVVDVPFQMTWKIGPHAAGDTAVEDDVVEASELFTCLRRFLDGHRGEFALRFGTAELKFDLAPDLSTVFEELPSILESLTKETIEPVELYFFEQGTDLAIELERHGESVTVELRKGPSVGRRFAQIPEGMVSVDANEFLGEWCRFLQEVLDELAGFDARVRATGGDRSYSARLAGVRQRIVVNVPRPRRRFVGVGEVVAAGNL